MLVFTRSFDYIILFFPSQLIIGGLLPFYPCLSLTGFHSSFTIKASDLGKFQELLINKLSKYNSTFTNISRISLVGYGIMNNTKAIKKTLEILKINAIDIFSIQLEECKLSIMTKEKVNSKILEQLHNELIK